MEIIKFVPGLLLTLLRIIAIVPTHIDVKHELKIDQIQLEQLQMGCIQLLSLLAIAESNHIQSQRPSDQNDARSSSLSEAPFEISSHSIFQILNPPHSKSTKPLIVEIDQSHPQESHQVQQGLFPLIFQLIQRRMTMSEILGSLSLPEFSVCDHLAKVISIFNGGDSSTLVFPDSGRICLANVLIAVGQVLEEGSAVLEWVCSTFGPRILHVIRAIAAPASKQGDNSCQTQFDASEWKIVAACSQVCVCVFSFSNRSVSSTFLTQYYCE